MKRFFTILTLASLVFGTAFNISAEEQNTAAPQDTGRTEDNPYEHPFQEAAIAKPEPADEPNTGYKKGFYLKTPDDNFKFQVNGRFQPVVYYTKTKGNPANWTFLIQRARLDFSMTAYKKVSANLSINYGTKSALFSSINLYNMTVD